MLRFFKKKTQKKYNRSELTSIEKGTILIIWNNNVGTREEIINIENTEDMLIWQTLTENNVVQYRRPIEDGLEIRFISIKV